MKIQFWVICVVLIIGAGSLHAQFTGDVLGMHDLSPTGSAPITGGALPPCQYCHAPHSGVGKGPLWAQTFSSATYTTYSSTTTSNQTMQQPQVGGPSSLCLSCHDGTVGLGQSGEKLQSVPYGQIQMQGTLKSNDFFGTNLQNSHPFSFNKLQDSPDLVQSIVQNKQTGDPSVKLFGGNVACESCHTPHVENIDPTSLTFMVRNNSASSLCLACHGTLARTVNNVPNPLVPWPTSVHATISSSTLPAANVGSYNTVALNACTSCHVEHNANGPARLLRGTTPPVATLDASTQNCITCHNGNNNIIPALPNVYAESTKTYAHPFPSVSGTTNTHDTAESVLLNNNRHATCVDCHNPHGSQQVGSVFPNPPLIRISQAAVNGVLASDGVSTISPAQNQYENCLRCHGTSSGKPTVSAEVTAYGYLPTWAVSYSDPANVIPQFAAAATSSHPVTHDSSSALAQPSLLPNMLQLDGSTSGRAMGVRIFCTDCHNSDDNREFGQTGPNGPHGSIYPHILERRYEMSQVATGVAPAGGPGTAITNTFPGQLTSAGGASPGPWALCGKCHNLTTLLSDNMHSLHVAGQGASCSVCHTAHGMGATSSNITGERLVNFDTNVVAPISSTVPISYSRNSGNDTCTLLCHTYSHTASQLNPQSLQAKPKIRTGAAR